MTKPTKWLRPSKTQISLGILRYPLSAHWRLWSDWAGAQADLSLPWAHSHFVGFVTRWLIWQYSKDNFLQFSIKNICCGYSLELPPQGDSNEYPQHMFLWRNMKIIPKLSQNTQHICSTIRCFVVPWCCLVNRMSYVSCFPSISWKIELSKEMTTFSTHNLFVVSGSPTNMGNFAHFNIFTQSLIHQGICISQAAFMNYSSRTLNCHYGSMWHFQHRKMCKTAATHFIMNETTCTLWLYLCSLNILVSHSIPGLSLFWLSRAKVIATVQCALTKHDTDKQQSCSRCQWALVCLWCLSCKSLTTVIFLNVWTDRSEQTV